MIGQDVLNGLPFDPTAHVTLYDPDFTHNSPVNAGVTLLQGLAAPQANGHAGSLLTGSIDFASDTLRSDQLSYVYT